MSLKVRWLTGTPASCSLSVLEEAGDDRVGPVGVLIEERHQGAQRDVDTFAVFRNTIILVLLEEQQLKQQEQQIDQRHLLRVGDLEGAGSVVDQLEALEVEDGAHGQVVRR